MPITSVYFYSFFINILRMDFRTSSYFFPSNRHRIKSELKDSPLRSVQRREIKENLSSYISTQHQPSLYYPVVKKKKTKSVQESRNTSSKRMRTEETASKPSNSYNLGIYKILQKVKVLKEEERELETNPFYKIQKYRKNSKLAQFNLKRKQESRTKTEKLEELENEPLKIEPKLFQN